MWWRSLCSVIGNNNVPTPDEVEPNQQPRQEEPNEQPHLANIPTQEPEQMGDIAEGGEDEEFVLPEDVTQEELDFIKQMIEKDKQSASDLDAMRSLQNCTKKMFPVVGTKESAVKPDVNLPHDDKQVNAMLTKLISDSEDMSGSIETFERLLERWDNRCHSAHMEEKIRLCLEIARIYYHGKREIEKEDIKCMAVLLSSLSSEEFGIFRKNAFHVIKHSLQMVKESLGENNADYCFLQESFGVQMCLYNNYIITRADQKNSYFTMAILSGKMEELDIASYKYAQRELSMTFNLGKFTDTVATFKDTVNLLSDDKHESLKTPISILTKKSSVIINMANMTSAVNRAKPAEMPHLLTTYENTITNTYKHLSALPIETLSGIFIPDDRAEKFQDTLETMLRASNNPEKIEDGVNLLELFKTLKQRYVIRQREVNSQVDNLGNKASLDNIINDYVPVYYNMKMEMETVCSDTLNEILDKKIGILSVVLKLKDRPTSSIYAKIEHLFTFEECEAITKSYSKSVIVKYSYILAQMTIYKINSLLDKGNADKVYLEFLAHKLCLLLDNINKYPYLRKINVEKLGGHLLFSIDEHQVKSLERLPEICQEALLKINGKLSVFQEIST